VYNHSGGEVMREYHLFGPIAGGKGGRIFDNVAYIVQA
jgi:hypothetical protein